MAIAACLSIRMVRPNASWRTGSEKVSQTNVLNWCLDRCRRSRPFDGFSQRSSGIENRNFRLRPHSIIKECQTARAADGPTEWSTCYFETKNTLETTSGTEHRSSCNRNTLAIARRCGCGPIALLKRLLIEPYLTQRRPFFLGAHCTPVAADAVDYQMMKCLKRYDSFGQNTATLLLLLLKAATASRVPLYIDYGLEG